MKTATSLNIYKGQLCEIKAAIFTQSPFKSEPHLDGCEYSSRQAQGEKIYAIKSF